MARKRNRAVGLSSMLILQMLAARAVVGMEPSRLVLGAGYSGEGMSSRGVRSAARFVWLLVDKLLCAVERWANEEKKR